MSKEMRTGPEDRQWMLRSIELAARARGRTAPNPMVGAVVVRGNEVLAEGWHHAAGLDHAETCALKKLAPGEAKGATMYLNLEPCCHHGRTPPCTDVILETQIARVVVGMVDPDSRVSGRGNEILRKAGLQVDVGVAEQACRRLNQAYLMAQEHGRPWVTLKAGVTLDGRIAAQGGESRWITCPASREMGHQMRDTHDAVLIGSGTLHADDPSLTTRIPNGQNALPAVLDTELTCSPDARLLRAGRRPVLLCATDAPGSNNLPAEVVRIPRSDQGLDILEALKVLVDRNVHAVLVEGGGRVHRSLLDAGLVDRVVLFVAPKVLSGGPGWVGGSPYALRDAPQLTVVSTSRVGDDVCIILEPTCSAES
jgi:diaminohydroxyphosphoribosylaminopyrimidine deaminase/5-amino-6-(5-phosphoribosylamino)uracil reductase